MQYTSMCSNILVHLFLNMFEYHLYLKLLFMTAGGLIEWHTDAFQGHYRFFDYQIVLKNKYYQIAILVGY